MLSEFVNTLAEQARKAAALEVVNCSDLRKVLVRKGDQFEEHAYPPVPRGGKLLGFEDIVVAASDGDYASKPEVYHAPDSLVLVCNRDDRHDRTVLGLVRTQKFRTLMRFEEKPTGYSIRELIKLLRFTLGGSGAAHVIQSLRQVDFTRRSDGSSNVEHGKETLGRNVEAAVQQADQIPETFTVTVPVYTNPGFVDLSTVDVELGLHIDLEEERIEIKPLADQLDLAVNRAHGAIGNALRSRLENTPVFYGQP